jgi:hypothetical protein
MKKVAVACSLVLILGMTAWASASQNREKQAEQAALRKQAKIPLQEAEKTALANEPGTIKSKELEKENGSLIYSFDIQTSSGIHEVHVDAISGQLLEDRVESNAAETKEKQQESTHHGKQGQALPPSHP